MKQAKIKLNALEVDLKYYNTKLIGCSAISYDSIKSSSPNSTNDKMIFWLTKIKEAEKEIEELNRQIAPLFSLVSALSSQEQQVLELLIMNPHRGDYVADKIGVSRNRVYEIRNSIIKKWMFQNFYN